MYDYISPFAPFAFVGIFDLLFAITAIVLGYLDILKDDHAIRRLREYEAREALRQVEQESDYSVDDINT